MQSVNPQGITLQEHTTDEVVKWIEQFELSPRLAETPERFIKALPLDYAPAPDVRADDALETLQWEYPHAQYVDLQATAAVTSLVKHDFAESGSIKLLPPSRLREGAPALAATERGTAVHKFLECFDFSQPIESLSSQLNEMAQKRILTPKQVEVIDLDAIEWMLQTPLGKLMSQNAEFLLRELPIIRAVSPTLFTRDEEMDPKDRVLLRGRVDLLVPMAGGYCLVDYKTDQVDGLELEARASDYRTQLDLYREALEPVLKVQIPSAALIFLHAKRIVQWGQIDDNLQS
jgi:ATP-dependent exoDNAse (exonuclease V) beta subunit